MDTLDYLHAVKTKLGISSDYALAGALGLTRSAISKLQARKAVMSDETALKIAAILEMPNPLQVLAAASRERNKNPEVIAAWTGIMEKFSTSFNSLMLQASPRRTYVTAR